MKALLYFLITILSTNAAFAQNLIPTEYKDKDYKYVGLITDNTNENRPAVLILPA